MLSTVLVTALAGLLFQSAPGAGSGTVATGSVSGGLKSPNQTTSAALPAKRLPPEELGDIFMARKRYREALEQYGHCDQKSAVIVNKMGIAYNQLLDLSRAMKLYKRATRLDPHYSEAFNNLGTIYYSQKSYRRAIHLYKTALRLAPNSATVYSNLGSAYLFKGMIDEALAELVRASELSPDHPKIREMLESAVKSKNRVMTIEWSY